MENFIESIGERYLERKANAVPQQLENLAKKQFREANHSKQAPTAKAPHLQAHEKDEEIARLRQQLAAFELEKAKSPKSHLVSREPSESGRSHAKSRGTRSVVSREDVHEYHRSPSPRLHQGDINRLALQHADSGVLPLKARNLELLASEQAASERASEHGGSAALIHASRSQHSPRETLACVERDAQGHRSTEAFRPHRAVDDNLYLIEVEEEAEEPRYRTSHYTHHVRPSKVELPQTRRGLGAHEREAVEVSRTATRRIYKIE